MNLTSNEKSFPINQSLSEKVNIADRKNKPGDHTNSSSANNSMFIVDWQITSKKEHPLYEKIEQQYPTIPFY